MFIKHLFKLKSIIYIFICIFLFSNKLKSNIQINASANWDLWYYYPLENKSNQTYISLIGNSNAVINSENKNISLVFGINSSRDGNFNFINNKELLLYGNLYVISEFNNNSSLEFGFKPGDMSSLSILEYRYYNDSVPKLTLFKNYNNSLDERVIFDGSYMQYNNAFAFTYKKQLYLSNTNFGITFIPSLDYNISKNVSIFRKIQKHLGALDGYIKYYNEYNDIGYGLIAAARMYTKTVFVPKGLEFYISPNIDYLGFGATLSLLNGIIQGYKDNLKYQISEISLYYSILKLHFIANYGYYNIQGGSSYGNNNYKNFSLGVNYLITSKFILKSALYYHETSNYKNNKGLSVGFSIKI